MRIVIYGFGRMGKNLALNALEKGHEVFGFDIDQSIKENLNQDKIFLSDSFRWFTSSESLFYEIEQGDVIFLFVPPGEVTDQVLALLLNNLPTASIVIEGGNSHFEKAKQWSLKFESKGIHFLDMGTSGGLSGARNGLCAMVGGSKKVFDQVQPVLSSLCSLDGLLYTGEAGSGHFLKMVHNGIEYGMMQSIAEGFELLEKSEFHFDYHEVAKTWNNGSVIRSWLMELLVDAFKNEDRLENVSSKMHASGEVKWLIEESIKLQSPMPVTYLSLMMRNRSLEEETFSGKIVSALRNSFGGHNVSKG
ncbi:6-phosphogluconate dehydrogenase [Ureibacillus massiliensis 4400831 = CIP 108448 = CCUG 49529]|uniref:6-phosphogluconate dehydrogenase n=1 Tax=Ureibacillus massiliensis 4400831 = CIP 108448 = CCUG 49529 TaxID=1211035 RepID=A0A0A3J2D0_9BACL|nr:decarboxylating 6-phosphogluconate dehydrogenase [Ureibacillus massiliensis]KGR91111.1 6-phosphogluconate dehydrogenase [Ureibacillus massiliensis 4400831 = CIP 108448 = CCUG 49529]BDH62655.1 6-phosphogluconate dehydrogenase (decarboxylating) [Lysinibacillus sp. PLM2]